jgi:hypothetical protein
MFQDYQTRSKNINFEVFCEKFFQKVFGRLKSEGKFNGMKTNDSY